MRWSHVPLAVVPSLRRFLLDPLGPRLLAWLMGLTVACAALQADSLPGQVSLQCRLADGPWQDCHMQVEKLGLHWFLLVGGQRIEFRHDGRGKVTMLKPSGGWQPVHSRWVENTDLCWDGVCARGDIPLD